MSGAHITQHSLLSKRKGMDVGKRKCGGKEERGEKTGRRSKGRVSAITGLPIHCTRHWRLGLWWQTLPRPSDDVGVQLYEVKNTSITDTPDTCDVGR